MNVLVVFQTPGTEFTCSARFFGGLNFSSKHLAKQHTRAQGFDIVPSGFCNSFSLKQGMDFRVHVL